MRLYSSFLQTEMCIMQQENHCCIRQNIKEVLYEVRCLKSTEDMILALAGQFKQLSHEPEKFR